MEKKVSLTLTQNTYQKLSNYTKEYGLSVRYMLKVLIDDAIDNNRYPAIFNKQHIDNKRNDIVDIAKEVPATPSKLATKKECNDISKKIVSDNYNINDNSKKNVCSKNNAKAHDNSNVNDIGHDKAPANDNDIFHDEDYDILLKDIGNVQSLVENKIPEDDTDINDILG